MANAPEEQRADAPDPITSPPGNPGTPYDPAGDSDEGMAGWVKVTDSGPASPVTFMCEGGDWPDGPGPLAADLSGPLVSVVTGSFGRPQTIIERAVASVACQTYEPIEHIVVTDGPDEPTVQALMAHGYACTGPRRVVSLGRNWTQPYGNESNGAICRMVGGYLASGDIIGVLDDDNIWEPQHVAEMVACFEATGADVVFGDFHVPAGNVFACWEGSPPRVGNCDSSSYMYRWQTLKVSTWQPDGYTCDGLLAERLVAGGQRWARKQGATMRMTSQRFGAPD